MPETAEQEFIRHLRRSKNKGVDVDAVFVHMHEARWLAAARIFGVVLSILWCFVGPPATVWLIIICKREGIDVRDIPLAMVYWTCQGMGFISVLAFGFDLVKINIKSKPPLISAIERFKKGEITLQLEPIDDDGTDGGV